MQLDQGGLRLESSEDVEGLQDQGHLRATLPYIRIHESWFKCHFDESARASFSVTIKHLPVIDDGSSAPEDMFHVMHEILTLQGNLPMGIMG